MLDIVPGSGNRTGPASEDSYVDQGQAIGARLARGDDSALEDAYAEYSGSLLAFLRRYVGVDEAEDVLQRTFLDVWRSAARYDPEQRFSTWLFTVAHRRAVDALRTRRHPVVDVESLRDLVGEDGRDTVDRYADAADVRTAVQWVSPSGGGHGAARECIEHVLRAQGAWAAATSDFFA